MREEGTGELEGEEGGVDVRRGGADVVQERGEEERLCGVCECGEVLRRDRAACK